MWDCLNVSGEVEKKQKEPKIDEKKKTFAEKVREDVAMVDLSTMPKPGMKGNIPTIKIPRKSLERGLNYCKFSLIGRLDFTHIKLEVVKNMAREAWKPVGDWKIVPLGRGFFMIRLSCEEDYNRVWRIGGEGHGDLDLKRFDSLSGIQNLILTFRDPHMLWCGLNSLNLNNNIGNLTS
ncbi:hypothetical protein FRX31_013566 [Thalictrum thalictroides]|uniref:DUF4283 domain-containing protein n=1 Tax=Thalictrum thalictroides TaxID=46969 RepID=A0A7J6WHL0_THATH|nr:hypothetical protein FRX31_013566 [Thalictrum thalictroides]